MINTLINSAQPGTVRHVILHSFNVFALRVGGFVLVYAAALWLTRRLGASGYGVYAYATTWLTVLTIPALLGSDQLVLRETAACLAQQRYGRLRGLLRWAQRVTMGAACAVTGAGIGVVAVLWALGRSDRQMLIAIGIALLALPWLAFSNLRQGALRGLHRVTLCFVPELLVAPALTLAMLVAAGWLLGTHFKPLHAVAIMAACVVPAYLLGSWLLRRNLPPALTAAPVELHTGAWLRSAVPLMLISALYVMTARADTLLLGAIKGKEAVGLYDVARKLADCISFVLLTVNAVLAPNVARLYAQGAHAQLQRVVTWSARGVTAAALPLALILMFRGAWFLHFFGDKYDGMTSTLIVLCLGQIVNAASGSVGVILATTGHERDAVLGISIGGVLNVVANLVLIPRFSYNGAAWAFLASMITWNGLLAWFVYRRLGLDSTCLGILHRKPAHV